MALAIAAYAPHGLAAAADEAASRETRLADTARFLSADELEGRGIGTAGIDKAADYIAERFSALGLKTALFDGRPFQEFNMTIGAEPGEKNHLALVGADGEQKIDLEFGRGFTPLSLGGSGQLDLPLAFGGYGITGKDEKYDDYAGLNVEGKAVIVMRHEPQQDNPHSAFNGTRDSALAPFWRKVSNAYEHGAAAVIFVTDEFDLRKRVTRRNGQLQDAVHELTKAQAEFEKLDHPTLAQIDAHRRKVDELAEAVTAQGKKLAEEFDPLVKFQVSGSSGESSRIPVVHCRRDAIDQALKASLHTDLATLEREIDTGPAPHSHEIPGWRLRGEVTVDRREAKVKNVVAVLDGEGPHAEETIVIGAHYDHLGWGGNGSFLPAGKEIHNGADDNGSGTAALIEVARILAARDKKLPRRVVLIAFTGEERGLVGSARYCREPLVPIDQTVAMLNMDMVGRLKDEKLIVQGVDTAAEFAPLIDRLNERFGFDISRKSGGFGPSDHSSFYAKKVPVMHFFTGLHSDYHRPSDDFEKINVPGMRRVAEMVADVAVALAEADRRPTYVESSTAERAGGGDSDRPYFGSIPDFAQDQPGYALSGVTKEGPADKAGIKAGDIIVKFGDSKIGSLEDFDSALRKFKAGDKVPVTVKRGKEDVILEVTLAPPK
ncbi:MAG: M20/M25/M40 family metallo-hydrolase [Planctomycetia bacterium]|nr:M20/M25/M40 family metallo-hydrolase [Planctomycetia bacterium]